MVYLRAGPAMFNPSQRGAAMPGMFGAIDSLLATQKFISGALE